MDVDITRKNDVKFVAPKRRKDGTYELPKDPDRAKAIAYSTKAVSDFIVDMSQAGGTIEEVYERMLETTCFEGQAILKQYINLGMGKRIARDVFGYGYYVTKTVTDEFGQHSVFKYPYAVA